MEKKYNEDDVVKLYQHLKGENPNKENSEIYRQIEDKTGWDYATIVATLVRKDAVKPTENGMEYLIDLGGDDTGYDLEK